MNTLKYFNLYRFTIPAVIVPLLLIVACSRDNLVEYTNIDKGFSISFPKNWEKKEGFLGSTVIAMEPVDEGDGTFRSNVSVVVETVTPGTSKGDYYKLQLKSLSQLTRQIKDFKLHSNRYVNVSGERGKELIYSYTIGQMRVTILSRAVIKDEKGFIITGTTQNISEFSKKYKKIADTFSFQ